MYFERFSTRDLLISSAVLKSFPMTYFLDSSSRLRADLFSGMGEALTIISFSLSMSTGSNRIEYSLGDVCFE